MKLSQNEVILKGNCTWSKLYDFNGKAYTTLSLRVEVDRNVQIFVDVSVTNKDMENVDNQTLINTITSSKQPIYISGYLANKKDKIVVKANLSSIGVLETLSIGMSVNIAGYIETTDPMILKIPYRNVKENKTEYRKIPVELPPHITVNKYDAVILNGKLQPLDKGFKVSISEVAQVKSFRSSNTYTKKPATSNALNIDF